MRWEGWAVVGRTDMRRRGIEKAPRILEEHHPQYLDPKTASELDRMARSFQAEEIEAARSWKVSY